MTDLRFNDVVETTLMIGPDGKSVKGICKSCSEQQKITMEDFRMDTLFNLDGSGVIPSRVDEDVIEYVASMRSWNCCHENETPIDGFPEKPELSKIELGEA
jgi:hypothetical protein